MPEVKLGLLCRNQHTDWQSLLEAGARDDRLGFDSLWTWDHLPSSTAVAGGDGTGHASTAGTCLIISP